MQKQIREELPGFVRVYSDGTVDRLSDTVVEVPAEPKSNTNPSRDILIDAGTGVWARIYTNPLTSMNTEKLPVMLYFHGGGFVLGSPAWSIYHTFLKRLSAHSGSVVVSVAYRRAPEHRLPAQYHDGYAALRWFTRACGQGPLCKADPQNIFIAGDSAGANIAHNVILMAAAEKQFLATNNVKIRGLLSIQPFFGGLQVSEWERATQDPGLPRSWVDFFWRMALPEDANRGHPACDPLPGLPRAMALASPVFVPAALVCVSERDVLRERNLQYCACLRASGVDVECVVFRGVGHAFQILNPGWSAVDRMLNVVRDFVHKKMTAL